MWLTTILYCCKQCPPLSNPGQGIGLRYLRKDVSKNTVQINEKEMVYDAYIGLLRTYWGLFPLVSIPACLLQLFEGSLCDRAYETPPMACIKQTLYLSWKSVRRFQKAWSWIFFFTLNGGTQCNLLKEFKRISLAIPHLATHSLTFISWYPILRNFRFPDTFSWSLMRWKH